MLALIALTLAQSAPATADADTKAWWAITAELSGDDMEGRETGSPGHERAAKIVAGRLAKAGVKPLGTNGSWFQPIAMEETAIRSADIRVDGAKLRFLHDLTASPTNVHPTFAGMIVYRGYCGADALGDVRGKIVICHNTRRAGLPSADDREKALTAAGATAMLAIADPGFTVEPPRWPSAYARSVRIAGTPVAPVKLPVLTLNADALGKLIGPRHDAAKLIADGSSGAPLPSFDPETIFTASFDLTQRKLSSSNVIGILPGTDPAFADQAIVLTAHLDGYGHGEPVDGDGLYNGTLDDAAYVALIVRLAERRAGKGFRRPIVFAIVTGEEKGLLGSRYFVEDPTLPLARIAGNINLDQLRPIFPLELLTVHALDDSTLGDDARAVATGMGIAVQHDPEPERRLLMRTDHWNFIRAGIPATNFVFGYRPGTQSEAIYRQWYRTGYHKPQDDLNQPMDWKAAADFNRFFYTLTQRVADKDTPPQWKPDSKLKPKAP
ncbi:MULTISPECIES: M28 family metallopeptidase [unclassified Sphingomonas]|uniref:M28 family metallopeptidase n=1 Tax=unclassified Sphingomonas TaxID=196159 RepID=UPI0021515D63|nr:MULTISPECIES: M28 family metallopeptidase [unclassified Sphingomonas]MCR5869434.1 M28 family metallopeptidase [Sphingomonas sp. J344]UUX98836.1 M28 family metallopeptidase [Sphingomonas sp. J315]